MAIQSTRTEPETDLVLIEREGGIATLTLNRPAALNALSRALRSRLVAVLEELATDEKVEVLVLTGAGRAFCVGLDLKELGQGLDALDAVSSRDVSIAMARLHKPVIGAVNGYAVTGGFELALMCDFLIASPNAQFADTHARVGVVPGWGLSQKLPRLIGINRAKELSLTGNYIDAETALAWGLVNRIVDGAELLAVCRSLAADIVSTDKQTRDEIKRVMDVGWLGTLREGLEVEQAANREHKEAHLSSADVAARRDVVQRRGRGQST